MKLKMIYSVYAKVTKKSKVKYELRYLGDSDEHAFAVIFELKKIGIDCVRLVAHTKSTPLYEVQLDIYAKSIVTLGGTVFLNKTVDQSDIKTLLAIYHRGFVNGRVSIQRGIKELLYEH